MNDLACKEFCKHISHTFKADLQDSLRAATCKFISIMADGATMSHVWKKKLCTCTRDLYRVGLQNNVCWAGRG